MEAIVGESQRTVTVNCDSQILDFNTQPHKDIEIRAAGGTFQLKLNSKWTDPIPVGVWQSMRSLGNGITIDGLFRYTIIGDLPDDFDIDGSQLIGSVPYIDLPNGVAVPSPLKNARDPLYIGSNWLHNENYGLGGFRSLVPAGKGRNSAIWIYDLPSIGYYQVRLGWSSLANFNPGPYSFDAPISIYDDDKLVWYGRVNQNRGTDYRAGSDDQGTLPIATVPITSKKISIIVSDDTTTGPVIVDLCKVLPAPDISVIDFETEGRFGGLSGPVYSTNGWWKNKPQAGNQSTDPNVIVPSEIHGVPAGTYNIGFNYGEGLWVTPVHLTISVDDGPATSYDLDISSPCPPDIVIKNINFKFIATNVVTNGKSIAVALHTEQGPLQTPCGAVAFIRTASSGFTLPIVCKNIKALVNKPTLHVDDENIFLDNPLFDNINHGKVMTFFVDKIATNANVTISFSAGSISTVDGFSEEVYKFPVNNSIGRNVTLPPDIRVGWNLSIRPPAFPYVDCKNFFSRFADFGDPNPPCILNDNGDLLSGTGVCTFLGAGQGSSSGIYTLVYESNGTEKFSWINFDGNGDKTFHTYDETQSISGPGTYRTLRGQFDTSSGNDPYFIAGMLKVTASGGTADKPAFAIIHCWMPDVPQDVIIEPHYANSIKNVAALRDVDDSGAISHNAVEFSDLRPKGKVTLFPVKSIVALQGDLGLNAKCGMEPGIIPVKVTLDCESHPFQSGMTAPIFTDKRQQVFVPVDVSWCPPGSNGFAPDGTRYTTPINISSFSAFIPELCAPNELILGGPGGIQLPSNEPRGDSSWRYSTALDNGSDPPTFVQYGLAGILMPKDHILLCKTAGPKCAAWSTMQPMLSAKAIKEKAKIFAGEIEQWIVEYTNEWWNSGTLTYHWFVSWGYRNNIIPGAPFNPSYASKVAMAAFCTLSARCHDAAMDGWIGANRKPEDLIRTYGIQGGVVTSSEAVLEYLGDRNYPIDALAQGAYIVAGPHFDAKDLDIDVQMDLIDVSIRNDGIRESAIGHYTNLRKYAAKYNVPIPKLFVYEGGPDTLHFGGPDNVITQQSQQAHRHPRLRNVLFKHLSDLKDAGVELYNFYTSHHNYYNEALGSAGPPVTDYGAHTCWCQPDGLGDGTDGLPDNRINPTTLVGKTSVVGGVVQTINAKRNVKINNNLQLLRRKMF